MTMGTWARWALAGMAVAVLVLGMAAGAVAVYVHRGTEQWPTD